jgi:Uncharacterized protein conserved in bacteria (DUF2188)/Hemerythrin HHE cation binding domain
MVLYPGVRAALPQGDTLAREALDEHREAKQVLADLDDMSPDDAAYDAKVRSLIKDVRHHVGEEENEMFPKLGSALSRAELENMGERMEKAKALGPTRPHPLAPESPPGNLVAGAIAGVADRVRDLISGRRKEEAIAPPTRKKTTKKATTRKTRRTTTGPGRRAGARGPVIHVTADPRGGWRAARQGSSRALARSDSKQDVVSRAREQAKRQNGRLVVHKQNGTIQEERTYGPDPSRSKG